MSILNLTNDADGTVFPVVEPGPWLYAYVQGGKRGHCIRMLNKETGELVELRESPGEYFRLCENAGLVQESREERFQLRRESA